MGSVGGGGRCALGGGALGGARVGDVLAVAGAVDVDADGVHRESVEDGHRDGGVAEVAPPVAESDIGGHRGRDTAMPAIDEVEEHVSGGGLVVALLDLAETDIVDHEQLGTRPGLEPSGIGAVGEAGVQVVDEVDAAGVAHGESLLAGPQSQGLEEMALAGAALAGKHQVIVPSHEVEPSQLEDKALVEGGLEVEVEGLEGLLLSETARGDATRDARFELGSDLGAEDVLEQDGGAGSLAGGPGQELIGVSEAVSQSEEAEVSSESLGNGVIGEGRVEPAAVSSGHEVFSWSPG